MKKREKIPRKSKTTPKSNPKQRKNSPQKQAHPFIKGKTPQKSLGCGAKTRT